MRVDADTNTFIAQANKSMEQAKALEAKGELNFGAAADPKKASANAPVAGSKPKEASAGISPPSAPSLSQKAAPSLQDASMLGAKQAVNAPPVTPQNTQPLPAQPMQNVPYPYGFLPPQPPPLLPPAQYSSEAGYQSAQQFWNVPPTDYAYGLKPSAKANQPLKPQNPADVQNPKKEETPIDMLGAMNEWYGETFSTRAPENGFGYPSKKLQRWRSIDEKRSMPKPKPSRRRAVSVDEQNSDHSDDAASGEEAQDENEIRSEALDTFRKYDRHKFKDAANFRGRRSSVSELSSESKELLNDLLRRIRSDDFDQFNLLNDTFSIITKSDDLNSKFEVIEALDKRLKYDKNFLMMFLDFLHDSKTFQMSARVLMEISLLMNDEALANIIKNFKDPSIKGENFFERMLSAPEEARLVTVKFIKMFYGIDQRLAEDIYKMYEYLTNSDIDQSNLSQSYESALFRDAKQSGSQFLSPYSPASYVKRPFGDQREQKFGRRGG